MSILKSVSRAFGLDDDVWMRHANPWSVWTRFAVLPVFALLVWSRVWIGWYCVSLIAALAFWTWINPRAFPKPKTTGHWASKAVLGERVWLQRDETPIDPHHLTAITVLNALTAAGLPFLAWGLYDLHVWSVLIGLLIVIFGKLWFLDRMVWVYEDMKSKTEEYASWDY